MQQHMKMEVGNYFQVMMLTTWMDGWIVFPVPPLYALTVTKKHEKSIIEENMSL